MMSNMKKRGRKAGTTSFIQVSLDDLNKCLKPNAKVIIWNRYAAMLGLYGKNIEAKPEVLIAAVNSGNIDLTLENFNEDILPAVEQNAKHTESEVREPLPDLVPKPSVSLEIF